MSPGTTGLRKRALSMPMKKTSGGSLSAMECTIRAPAVCAIASTISTPGITRISGKWPWKCGSLIADGLVAVGAFEGHDVRQPLDEEERRAVRQQLLDLLHVQDESGMSAVTHGRHVSASLPDSSMRAFRGSIRGPGSAARRHSPGRRHSRCRAGTPARAAMRAPSPILTWSAMPTWPPMTTKSPNSQLPAMPTWRDDRCRGGRDGCCGRSGPGYRSWCPRRSPCRRARRGRWWCRRRSRPGPG